MEPSCADPIVRNHLAFLDTHRGQVIETRASFRFEGQAPFLSFFAPRNGSAQVDPECKAVWLYPSCGGAWADRLSAAGFVAAERMAYMQLGSRAARRARVAATIERVQSPAAASEFAWAQERGFLADESERRAWWADCFACMARRNHARSDQDFLLARVQGAPAAVLLTVRTPDTVGIYAVATVPEHRGKGLSTALLDEVIGHTAAAGTERIVLQVIAGSYAHDFYRRRGFEDSFDCQVWRR